MRLQVVSDLHLEARPYTFVRAQGADVLVLAGDLAPPSAHGRLHQLLTQTKDMKVVVVAGNHDHYGDYLEAPLLKELLKRFRNVHLLDNSYVDIDGVRFVGGTLWSDFLLYGTQERSMQIASYGISDFRTIFVRQETGHRLVTPEDMVKEHAKCLDALRIHGNARTVIVTHFLPLWGSIHKQFDGSPYNAYFTSDCARIVDQAMPLLWIHGHTHSAADYTYGKTRVICNPRGYDRFENPKFDPLLTVDV